MSELPPLIKSGLIGAFIGFVLMIIIGSIKYLFWALAFGWYGLSLFFFYILKYTIGGFVLGIIFAFMFKNIRDREDKQSKALSFTSGFLLIAFVSVLIYSITNTIFYYLPIESNSDTIDLIMILVVPLVIFLLSSILIIKGGIKNKVAKYGSIVSSFLIIAILPIDYLFNDWGIVGHLYIINFINFMNIFNNPSKFGTYDYTFFAFIIVIFIVELIRQHNYERLS